MKKAPDREFWRKIAAETIEITTSLKMYEGPNGEIVELDTGLAISLAGTQEWGPKDPLPTSQRERPVHSTLFEIRTEPTLDAARRLAKQGERPLVLSFASAKNPGGGFQNGSMAQEESLVYASGLYPTLLGRRMYSAHTIGNEHRYLYGDYVILSPEVPVFRNSEGELLPNEEVWSCSFLTVPAPNADGHLKHHGNIWRGREEVRATLRRRMKRFLTIAQHRGYENLVLGAWGCGVFGCDPDEVATTFSEAFDGPFKSVFKRVVFAINEDSITHRNVRPFVQKFGIISP